MRYPMRVLLLSMACSAALSAQAQAAPGRIDLPAGELATALNTLAKRKMKGGHNQIVEGLRDEIIKGAVTPIRSFSRSPAGTGPP